MIDNKYMVGNTLIHFNVSEIIGMFGMLSMFICGLYLIIIMYISCNFDYISSHESKLAFKCTYIVSYLLTCGFYLLTQIM